MKHLPNNNAKIALLYAIGLALLVCAAMLGILLGATQIDAESLLSALFGKAPGSTTASILWLVRMPRVLASLLCGAALAASGAVIQTVLRNALASPSIIGVNAGAALAVTLCSALGILSGWQLSFFAFLGAFAAVMTVSLGAKKWGASRGTVILMGVALNSLLGACSDTITVFVPEVSILRNAFRIGDFSSVTYPKLIPAAVVITSALFMLRTLSNELDVLSLGEDAARSLGMRTGFTRTVVLLLCAALAGTAVSIAGLVPFVGLLVPHALRRMQVRQMGHLLTLCALYGAGFVTLCDTLSRMLFAPYEVPVGILMSFLGAPFFLFLLFRTRGDRHV